jgi:predicted nucleic acid-binding protein
MILVDTSVWIDHLRAADRTLTGLLAARTVLVHPFVTGELALGNLRQRDLVLRAMKDLPQANVATDEEVLFLINRHALFGSGIGYVDAHLLAAVRLAEASLWTREQRLRGVAERLGLAASALP